MRSKRGLARTQRHRQIGAHLVDDAEFLGDLDHPLHADLLGHAHGHEVARHLEAAPHRGRPEIVAAIVLGRPDRLAVARVVGERRVEHDRGRREARIHGREIDERLERRARLARRLDGAVELAAAVGPAARHGEHAAGLGVHHHHAALDIGHLAQRVGPGRIRLGVLAGRLLDLLDHDHVADIDDILRAARRRAETLLGQGRRGPGHFGEGHGALAAPSVA